jgi:UDP-N-acetylglucosamine 2-epimerase (non-hydrolysing)
MRIASIIGIRPEFIQSVSLSRELQKEHEVILIHTGQHYNYEMSKIFFEELEIPEPDYNLSIGSNSHGQQTGEMLMAVEKVLIKEEPDVVIVYGDSNTTLAGALAAAKLHIRLAHVEAGLRSFDRSMPEEINRVLTDHISDFLFCPTETAVENLAKEGIKNNVFLVGDVTIETLKRYMKLAEKKSSILSDLNLTPKEYLVVTVHRAGNVDSKKNLSQIVNALCGVDELIVFPVHPRTLKNLKEFKLYEKLSRKAKLIDPLGYLDMVKLLSNAKKIFTDSGGIQKEAYILRVPCITLRENTEWVETVEEGWNILTGRDRDKIIDAVKRFEGKKKHRNIFGRKNPSKLIRKILRCGLKMKIYKSSRRKP